jgi:fumarylacetoacetase
MCYGSTLQTLHAWCCSSPQQPNIVHPRACACVVCAGDLLGTGTQSGPSADQLGCLLEITHNNNPDHRISLPTGPNSAAPAAPRGYLEDGDEVVIRGWCERPEVPYRLGFGDCRGKVVPSAAYPG